MRDDKISNHHKSSGHHGSNSKHGGSGGNASTFADMKAEASRGLELLDKIVNDAAQVKWILKNVLTNVGDLERTSLTKCPNCSSNNNKKDHAHGGGAAVQTSPSKDNSKRDKKAKKAVLPMVSGHTVQRPSINIPRVDSVHQQQRQRDGETTGRNEERRRPGPSSKTKSGSVGGTASKRQRGSDSEGDGGKKKERRGSRWFLCRRLLLHCWLQ